MDLNTNTKELKCILHIWILCDLALFARFLVGVFILEPSLVRKVCATYSYLGIVIILLSIYFSKKQNTKYIIIGICLIFGHESIGLIILAIFSFMIGKINLMFLYIILYIVFIISSYKKLNKQLKT